MAEKFDTPVLIVGAGPTGLALAAALQARGVAARIIDNQVQGANTSRAAVVHARTLEVLDPLGVTKAMLAEGLKVPYFRIRNRDRVLLEVDFGGLATDYPYTLMLPQNRTEAILSDHLAARGGNVQRPQSLKGFERTADGIVATVDCGGVAEKISGRWLIGCDGAHSLVRTIAAVPFEGSAYPEHFVLADVAMSWPYPSDEVDLFFSSAGLMVVAPLPGGRHRVVATMREAPEHPSAADMQAILDARGPTAGARIDEVVWSSRFHVQHRTTQTPRRGRVLLCGDAAHVHSPAGGQGMNTGIQDAVSLAQPLQTALETGDESLLEAWATERHRVAAEVVDMTDKMTRAATLRAAPARGLRNAALSIAGRVPGLTDAIARRLAELDHP